MAGLPEYMRAFTAIELDPSLRMVLREETEPLLRGTGKLGFVPEENLHVTMKFLGDVRRGDLAALDEVVAEAAARLVPGEVEVQGIGAFPNLERPRVIWAGVSDPEDILAPVHSRLNETLIRFGAKKEYKRYVPHVTLARARGRLDARLLEERIERLADARFGAQTVRSVTLFMSEFEKGAPPKYTALGHYGPGG